MAAYAVRYPERVSGLVLISPAGLPRAPGYDPKRKEGEKNKGGEEERKEEGEAAEMEVEGEKTKTEPRPLWRKGMMSCQLHIVELRSLERLS